MEKGTDMNTVIDLGDAKGAHNAVWCALVNGPRRWKQLRAFTKQWHGYYDGDKISALQTCAALVWLIRQGGAHRDGSGFKQSTAVTIGVRNVGRYEDGMSLPAYPPDVHVIRTGGHVSMC